MATILASGASQDKPGKLERAAWMLVSWNPTGILNGMDDREWNPATDVHLPQRYTPATVRNGKALCKAALQEELGLPQAADVPVATPRPFEVLPVSSRSAAQRDRLLQLAGKGTGPLRDQAVTLQSGRARFRRRGALVRLTAVAVDDIPLGAAGSKAPAIAAASTPGRSRRCAAFPSMWKKANPSASSASRVPARPYPCFRSCASCRRTPGSRRTASVSRARN